MSFISEQLENKIGRRNLLQLSAFAGASLVSGGLLAGCGGSDNNNDSGGSSSQTNTDLNTLNFALNLEYLEAEFYLRATGLGTGAGGGLAAGQIEGKGAQGNVTGGAVVPFASTTIASYAREIAVDELNHVLFLRSALSGEAVARPAINFTDTFAALGAAIGAPTFNPFADEVSFLLGAFIFEDVGVTAYKGAAPLLSKTYLAPAAGILAVEAYHSGSIRTVIAGIGGAAVQTSNAISDQRDLLAGTDADQGVGDNTGGNLSGVSTNSSFNIVPTDANSIAFDRTAAQVLRIVYANVNGTPGGFFPQGINTRSTPNSTATSA